MFQKGSQQVRFRLITRWNEPGIHHQKQATVTAWAYKEANDRSIPGHSARSR